jgi:hypothetical protein
MVKARTSKKNPPGPPDPIILGYFEAIKKKPTLTKRDYWKRASVEHRVSYGESNFYHLLRRHLKRSTEQGPPPFPGIIVEKQNHDSVYSCGHRVHEDFSEFTDASLDCATCTTTQKVWSKKVQADRNLSQRLKEYNNSILLEWPAAVAYDAKQLWLNVQLQWEKASECRPMEFQWWEYVTSMFSFQCFLSEANINVRSLSIPSMKKNPKETCEIHGASLPRNFNTRDNKWNPGQILKNPGDGSFGLVQFENGDYAGIGTVNLSNEVIAGLSRSETSVIQESKLGKRAGSSGGFMFPVDDPEVRKDTKSMSKCTEEHRLLTTSNGRGTQLTMHYIHKGKRKKVNSIYPDLAVDRKNSERKREMAVKDENMKKKLIGEMKSRLAFLMILVEKNLGTPRDLFKSFAAAVMRVKEGNSNWIVDEQNGLLSDFECVLLEYACGTGEMRNHQALFAHTDTNRSHPVESMMVFGKVPEGDKRESTTIVDHMTNGMLIQPYERIVWELRCGRDVLHCRFSVTYHLSDLSRGSSNWSYVHGP